MQAKDFKCETCKGNTKQVYETETNVFLKCRKGHCTGDGRRDYPVFMVNKKELAEEA